MRKWIAVLALALAALGCRSTHVVKAPVDREAIAYYAGEGSGAVEGQAFMRTLGGEVRYAAGCTVYLWPKTAHLEEAADGLCRGLNVNISPDTMPAQRTTVASAEGRFRFKGLPAGTYLALTKIEWVVPSGFGSSTTGGWVAAPVEVPAGATVEVVVASSFRK